MGKRKLYTEEELKERQRERSRRYYHSHKEERLKKIKEWQTNNKEKVVDYCKKAALKWYYGNIEKAQENSRAYYDSHKKERIDYHRQYTKTQMGRASYLRSAYISEDKKYNRGECDLTAQWIVDNIFTKSCVHCGESDWHMLGCNRLDNSKPHTMDNVEPCCWKCNLSLH